MVSVVKFTHAGAPEVLQVEEVGQSAPGAGEVWLEQEAIGVNFLDITQRNGAVPVTLPSGLGLEGAGRVAAVGEGVDNVNVGDRVAYATGPLGSYASGRLYPANKLVRIPDSMTFEEAAAVLFKGITAQYLLKSTYPVGPGTVMVLYGVAGGLGEIMAPWAKHLGAFVIGIVSREQSVDKAKALGCDAVLVFNPQTLAADVARITDGKKADVVYDPIGRVSFEASLNSLKPRGLMVSFGASSGAPAPLEISTLNAKGSLFLTRPSIVAHTTDIAEYQHRAKDVLAAVEASIIKPMIRGRYALSDVAQAHAALESGTSSGTLVLIP
ncbi:quinone oxidoreductase [Pseudomonas sp. CCI3.2]|uniref:quinone oxidoreductase family protein n=1 Tax=unclassified Pseudomonas TaxID=196821 RepID=UPI002AC8ADD0|nr:MULTISPECIES: quinone oxidoreductase [unclassified Pseudomonas]MEB0077708.1 quinone oxidoreductase [Pseudomonas sp. MH10out]MEB0090872.1 quinone oxidoreductase [Pseudomonas sp. CCI4.2]MEB0101298.1 quinone oxidoreductase [Pseudomonas sp. CCI3.2]MEB0131405.1 quinone oxidoreductase [Pseudomonas sp. CCI2.4]MEB0158415.1 quinone oxidoreductase [Pseudomonas sp. AH2 (2023)]